VMKHNSLGSDFGIYPSKRNRLQWSRLINKIYEINPTIVGTDRRFQQPEGITRQSVLAATGMKAGKVKLAGGKEINVSGDTKSEYFNTAFLPKTTTYDFAFGATPEELTKYWGG